MSEPGYPFRFYGVSPIEWREGANDGHAYEVTFREPPTTAAKAELARTWEAALARGPARGARSQPWRWNGRSAAFLLAQREEDARAFFTAAGAMVEALHAVWPIEEAVFRGAWWEEGDGPWGRDPWDAWSVRERQEPLAPFAKGSGDVDSAFERARRIAVEGEAAVLAAETAQTDRLAAGALALAPPVGPPITYAVPRGAAEQLGVSRADAHLVLGSPSGRVYVRPSSVTAPILWLGDDGALMRWQGEPIAVGPALSTDGARIAVAVPGPDRAGHHVLLVDLRDGQARSVWQTDSDDPAVRGLWVGRSRLAVMTNRLRLFEIGEGGVTELDQRGVEERAPALLVGLHDDRVLIVIALRGALHAYRIDRGRLEHFGSVPERPLRFKHWPLPATDGRRLVGVTDPKQEPIELMNVEARWRAAFDEPL